MQQGPAHAGDTHHRGPILSHHSQALLSPYRKVPTCGQEKFGVATTQGFPRARGSVICTPTPCWVLLSRLRPISAPQFPLTTLKGGRDHPGASSSGFSLHKNPSGHWGQHLSFLCPRTLFAMQANCANRTQCSATPANTVRTLGLNSHELKVKCTVLRGGRCCVWARSLGGPLPQWGP